MTFSKKPKRRPVPRYRVNVDAKDETGKSRKRVPLLVMSRRGMRRRILAAATIVRIGLERDALSRRNSIARLEEGEALRWLHGVPSVGEIAYEITNKMNEPKPELPVEAGRTALELGQH